MNVHDKLIAVEREMQRRAAIWFCTRKNGEPLTPAEISEWKKLTKEKEPQHES